MKFRLVPAILAAVACSTPVFAQQSFNGNAYLDMCSSKDIGLQNGCTGLQLGIVLGLSFWNNMSAADGGPSTKFCIPHGVSTEQGGDLITAYIKGHPETRHYPVGFLAELALLEAFPCP